MTVQFQRAPTNSGPAERGFTVTASDTVNFAYIVRGIYVGGAGDVVVVWDNDSTSTFSSVPAGTILPVKVKRVNSTNTTATNMVGLY